MQYVVLVAVALLVLATSFFSGQKGRVAETPKSPSAPASNQLEMFRKALEDKRREAEDAKKQLEARKLLEAKGIPASYGAQPAAGETDPFETMKRQQAYKAAFASNIAVRIEDPGEKPSVDLAPQIALRIEQKIEPQPSSSVKAEENSRAKESGRLLPAREGNLYRVFEGTIVQTVLSTRLEGSFTGPVNCIVSKDLFSKDQKTLLVPKGSQFLGKANRVEAQNQVRLAVSFKRLILPNGYSIDLDAAPGLDSAGETGLKDKVNNHYARSFGISGAIGLLGGLALYGGQGSLYAAGVANSAGSSATSVLSHFLNRVPTVTIREGHAVEVYLPSDLLLPEYRP